MTTLEKRTSITAISVFLITTLTAVFSSVLSCLVAYSLTSPDSLISSIYDFDVLFATFLIWICIFISLMIFLGVAITLYLQSVWDEVFATHNKVTFAKVVMWILMPFMSIFEYVFLCILAVKRGRAASATMIAWVFFAVVVPFLPFMEPWIYSFFATISVLVLGFLYFMIARIRPSKLVLVLGACMLIALGTQYLTMRISTSYIDSKISEVKHELVARGIPIDVAQFINYYYAGIQPDKAMTELVNEFVDDENEMKGNSNSLHYDFDLSTADIEAAREVINSKKAFFERSDAIFSSGKTIKYDFGTPPSLMANLPHPYLRVMRLIAGDYSFRIKVALLVGDRAEAKRLWGFMTNLIKSSSSEKPLLGALVYTSCDTIRLDTFTTLLKAGVFSSDELESIAKSFEEDEKRVVHAYRSAILAETAMSDFCNLILEGKSLDDITDFSDMSKWKKSPASFVYCYYAGSYFMALEYYLGLARELQSDDFNLFNCYEKMEKHESRIKNNIILAMLVQDLKSVFLMAQTHIALLRMARIGCAIEKFRLEKGHIPESLDELGELPTDPLIGAPFKYSHGVLDVYSLKKSPEKIGESKGWRLYGVGRNGIDDGGKNIINDDIFEVIEPTAIYHRSLLLVPES